MNNIFILSNHIMPAEWNRQDAILIAWPHRDTDWVTMLDEVKSCYIELAKAIVKDMRLIIVAPNITEVKHDLKGIECENRITYCETDTNDTWARDFGPISVSSEDGNYMLDFKFDAWGMKFAACYDNQVCRRISHLFNAQLINCQDFVLEGGSVESDGMGTILTTSRCLLSPNRNSFLNKSQIEQVLKSRLGAKKVLWLNNGELVGDDTDAHIDTLARLAPNNTIVYVKCDNEQDEQYKPLQLMEQELKEMTNANGERFNLVPLPCPTPIYDDDGYRLPATYANFLITNTQVLVPTYAQKETDQLALDTISQVFPDRNIIGIDCNSLIKQHGSLHCITMQIPENFIK